MSTRRPLKQISALKKTRRYRDHVRQTKRKMELERLEDRRVMTTGPTLVNVLSNFEAIENNETLEIAPREITLRFAEGQSIDPATIANGVRVTRGGFDRALNGVNDVVIQPGYIGLTDTPREIVVRFADNLPDDVYQIELIGTGLTPLRDTQGNAVAGGNTVTHNFNLDLGAQIVAIVPQPIRRVGNGLVQDANKIEVYFNPDLMNQASVTNPAYYKLIDTSDGDVQLPIDVQYTAVPGTPTTPGEYKAVLTFANNIVPGTFKLKAGVTDEQNNTLATAVHVGSTANPTTNFNFQSLYLGDDPNLQVAANDVDLYRFDLRGAVGTLVPFTATVAGTGTLNPALRLFDWQGNQIGSLADVAGNSETIANAITISADPSRNTIYLGVSSTGNIGYNPVTGQNATGGTTTGKYSLSASWNAAVPVDTNGNDSSFANANNAGILGLGGLTIPAGLNAQFYNIVWPGYSDDPGHRDLPPPQTGEEHLDQGPDSEQGIQVKYYNFPTEYGVSPQGNIFFNGITGNQRQRAREVFELYGRYLGVKFVEVPDDGVADYGIVTGDLRAIEETIPTGPGGVAGLAGKGLAIMDNAEAWGDSEYGGRWFNVAMHEIGHLLGLGHSYDLPNLTIQGSAESAATPGASNAGEPVFPGDHDILHGQTLYRPEGRDIDLYKFQLTERGRLTAETIAERLSDRPGVNSSQANTVLTLYRETIENGVPVRTIVSRNDDYFSSDSFLDLPDLAPGVYYVSVTSTGMTGIDPTVEDSGFGGTTDGAYELKLNFTPAVTATTGGMIDAQGTRLDGDLDGVAGGAYEFFFKSGTTIFVDKAKVGTGSGQLGTISNPFTTIQAALNAAEQFAPNNRPIVRIVGNGGTDGNMATLVDNLPYLIGYNDLGDELSDGFEFLVPQNVTVMIDAGAIIKLQSANIDAGSSTETISRAGGVIQVLGTPVHNVQLTSFSNDAIGGNTDGPTLPAAPGDWGGIVFRNDSDLENRNLFLNYVNNANITYGGGKVVVNASEEVFNPIHVVTARPTVTFNRISFSADAAMSADPDSFEDILATGPTISSAGVSSRIGPEIYGNTVVLNSFNGVFVRVRTLFGRPVEVLNTFARFDDTDIVHMVPQNLHIQGKPGGPRLENGRIVAEKDARLRIDPGVIVKLDSSRIEATVGAQLIAEGTDELPVIFTSMLDDRYGAGGTFDTSNDASGSAPAAGDWGGLMFNANSIGSIDRARIFYGGGITPIEGSFATFNPVEIHQADVRIAKSVFQFNAAGNGLTGNRSGRGSNGSATIFVRGAQPIIVDNVIRDNAGQIISINANAMQATVYADYGRSTGDVTSYNTLGHNFGPLVRLNRIVNNGTNGMEIRGGVLTTETIWDDTDIAHILRDQITILNHHTFSGLRLQSSAAESLVVKLFGQNAGFVASGVPMEITDRIGGTLHIIGQPNRPVVLTSLADDTVPAGLQPITGLPLYDTNNNGNATAPAPGDWNSIRLDQYSNDRNVAIIMESEPAYIGTINDPATGRPLGDANRVPRTQAQFLGNLAPNEKSGDDNRRLGFEVQGYIALDNAHDVDVYSFTADGQTEVWFDIDRTSYGLNTVIELVDANGTMLARSTDNETFTSSAFATARTFNKDPHLGRDFYGVNPKDASFRVTLPGNQKGVTYFIRVRSEGAAADINNINAGQTRGEYRLQVRVRQVDNKPGSTVRYSDIRYATNGVEVIGLPYHSPIAGESTERDEAVAPNNAFANAQYLGNLLTSDRGTISVGGSLSSAADVDFFSFDLDYDFLQVVGGVSDAAKTISAMFDIDYADGLARPDTTISVFNDEGELIYIGRDSDIQDDQPAAGQGLDSDDLSRGSFGKLDPYIGSAQLPAGSVGAGETRRYYVAISSSRRLPTAMNAQFQANAASPTIRLEPINSVRRVVEDRVSGENGSAMPQGASTKLFDITNAQTLAAHINTFGLSDAVLFTTGGTGVQQIDPLTGGTEVGNYGGSNDIRDITMRSDGKLFGYRWVNNNNTTAGQLMEFSTASNSWVALGFDNIADPPQGNTDFDLMFTNNVGALAFQGNGYDDAYNLYLAVSTNLALGGQTSWLYHADPNNGNVRDAGGPLGRLFQITSATSSSANAVFNSATVRFTSVAAGSAGDNIRINITEDTLGAGTPVGVDVDNTTPGSPTINVTLNTSPGTAQAQMTVGSVTFQFVADNPGPAGNNIRLVFSKQANVAGGANVTVTGTTINVVLDSGNVTAAQLQAALTNNPQANALINSSFTGDPLANVGPGAPVGTLQLAGGSPSSAQDIINAISGDLQASGLVTATLVSGNATAPINNGSQNFLLAGGTGSTSATTGMTYLDGTLYGVSANGGFFRINVSNGVVTPITTFSGVNFTGLAVGPQNVEGGRYSNMLFASIELPNDQGTRMMAFDVAGVPQNIFANETSSFIDIEGAEAGLAFSPLDFNLWHSTNFNHGGGNGVQGAPDNSRGGGGGGGNFYFGFEPYNPNGTTYHTMGGQTGTLNRQYGIMEDSYQRSLTSNAAMHNSYNFLGGAKGSMVSDGFSLEGYSRTDKPTFYFNYWLETEDRTARRGNMRDSARVFISTDNGATWSLIATNNAELDDPGTSVEEGELTTFKSTSTSELPGNYRQIVQELYDVGAWRQARVDLSDYAGQDNLKFRFDFSTSGVTGAAAFEDAFGNDGSAERGARNNFGGFAIDDLIVGFAERGEMVTGAAGNLTTFFEQPEPVAPFDLAPTPNEVLVGTYQLEIRRGADHGYNRLEDSAAITLTSTYDTNSRLILDTREGAPLPVQDFETGTFNNLRWGLFGDAPWTVVESPLGSGEYRAESGPIGDNEASTLELTADVGAGTITFDWGVSSEPGDSLIFYVDGVQRAIRTGNVPTTTATFTIATGGVHSFRWKYVKNGTGSAGLDRGWVDNIVFSNGAPVGMGVIGDENHWRDQGHIQIEQNLITDSELVGILVDAADRNITGTNLPFQGSVMKQMVPNVDDLAPGVALVNNTIGGYGTAGIRFSGDPNVPGQPVAASPFGRIVNNTVYGGATPRGVGIQVDQNAAPTILNNIISNAVTGIGVDGPSAPTTVVGFNLFKGNTNNGTVGSDAIQLAANEPLFVNPATRNFYLAANSRAIDSSINDLTERPSYHAVIAELGIPDSPILTPEFDMYGQKRLDDPGVTNPTPGQGGAIVKDRGAVERADFIGARVDLIDPLDNDLDGRDRNPALYDVVVKPSVAQFKLRLVDTGIGIDDLAVNPGQFTLLKDGVALVLGTDYSFVYNTNTDEVTFLPASGTWAEDSTYTIVVDNTVGTGVKDLAGNRIQPNRADGATTFSIYVGIPWDYSDAPAPYASARHDLSTSLYLGTTVPSAEQAPKLPNADDDDGLGDYSLVPGKNSSISYTSSSTGFLDVWVDLNADGDFVDAGESVGRFTTVAGLNTTPTFVLGAGNIGQTYMRMRLTAAGIDSPTADADDGEVEDHLISLTGPPFQNPNQAPGEPPISNPNDTSRRDVNADGFITAIDALIVINHLQRLNTYNANNNPDLPASLPIPGIVDDVGTAPNYRYVDVNGDGFLTNADALIIINWLEENPIGPSDGEGEGEGEASSQSFAAAGNANDSSALFSANPVYASSSIVIEERTVEVDAGEVAAQLLQSDSSFQQPAVQSQAWNSDDVFNAYGQDEDDEDLISILAFDIDSGDGELS